MASLLGFGRCRVYFLEVKQSQPIRKMIIRQVCSVEYSQLEEMKLLNKSSSMPFLIQEASQGTLTAKPHRRRLQELENEVSKSRMAIENMTHTRAIEGGLYMKVEQLQRQLHRCILSLNQQSQRGKVLGQLVSVLKGQMSAVQAVQRTSEQFVACGIQKKIKKVQYDIKQMLHKYNQEIAKINWLKEQANAARDERVVYSNLFNKIQKEIKHYEEIYKQTLIKNQIFLDKKRANSIPQTPNFNAEETPEGTQRIVNIDFKDRQSKISVSRKELKSKDQIKSYKYNTDRTNSNQPQAFITDPQTVIRSTNLSSIHKEKQNLPINKTPISKGIQAEIKRKEAAIESAVVHSQCRSLEEVFDLYGSVEGQNQTLKVEVEQLDENISYLEGEIDRLKRQKRSSEIYQNRQISQMANISKNCRFNKQAISDEPALKPHHHTTLIKKLCKLMEVSPQTLGDDVLRELDRKIEKLGCLPVKYIEKRSSRMAEEGSERGVVDLLDKIDKFGESEKIFDRNMLRAEYHKEVGKVRKRGKKTN